MKNAKYSDYELQFGSQSSLYQKKTKTAKEIVDEKRE